MTRTLFWAGCLLILGHSTASAQRTSVSRDFPIYANGGLPDLTPDPQRFESQMEIVDRLFAPDDCSVLEGAVGGTGYRRILRFDTVIINAGDGDLVVGDRSDPNNPYHEWFYFSPCHGHYHLRGFADYMLLRPDGSLAAAGHKQGFCMEDSFKYDGGKSAGFNCQFQGITSGWGDWYFKQLDGQWIDITGVPAGDYVVRVVINAAGTFDEGEDRYPNVVEVNIRVPDPRNKVAIAE
ncbi:MAG TPA: lysyl oxidase family protein [Haliangiales bacterium]|nr:lysyl oxidase family protein [Haliangiales bacterium]